MSDYDGCLLELYQLVINVHLIEQSAILAKQGMLK